MTGGRAVILGRTGRNVAAGMSGGVAYILDLKPVRVNTEMVELEPLSAEDAAWLRETINEHFEETESQVASELLKNWDASVSRFTKIMPRDYKRVLEAQAQAEAEGRDVLDAIMEAARG
jgi:glutamate synthase (NADPH/NADH) large chain